MKNIFAGIVAQMNSCRAVITLTLLALFLSINSLADWSTQRPDGDGPYGYWNSLALGPDLNPRIVYRDGEAGGNLRFLRWTGSSWQKETIETNFDSDGGHASLAISPTGDPRVSYFKTGVGLRFASKDGASWTYKTIDPEGGQYTSLKLDSSGMAHVSYYAADKLKYAKWDGVTWSTSAVEGGAWGNGHRSSWTMKSTRTSVITTSPTVI